MVLASLNTARSKGNDARRKADLRTLITAISQYHVDNGYLPRNQTGWCTYISNPTGGWGPGFSSDLVPKYISKVPGDPVYAGLSGDYFYSNQNNGNGNFTVCAILDQPTGQSYSGIFGGCSGWNTAYNYCVSQ